MKEHDSSPKMHLAEVTVDESTVRSLLSDQYSRWANLPLRRLPDSGTDNAIYRLGDSLGVRLPRIHWAVHQVDKEWQWLGRLAAHLPADIPIPVAKGNPGPGYPYPWLVYEWLEGEDLLHADVDDFNRLARDLAEFVLALGQIDPEHGPPAGTRGGLLAPHDEAVQFGIRGLKGLVDTDRAMAVWRAAVEADQWPGPPVWVHGDLLPGNILVRDGRMSGVIDWSAAGVGDPACEAMLAWSLPLEARVAFRDALDFDDATWARARGWVVEQTAFYIPYYANTLPNAVAAAKRRLRAVLDDPTEVAS